ncbi:MAG TPA: FG-GAP-like repeat-containing protein [Candidatus Binatia bacterium]|nr:FG-GAP-like repeat-containing protein [Candidatus Binatia bacterium]
MSRPTAAPVVVLYLCLVFAPAHAQFETRGRSLAEVSPYSVATGDFNHDGNLDMAVASAGTSGGPSVSVQLGRGDGTFLPATNYFAGVGPTSIAAAELNRDGNLDLVVANSLSNYISVFLGNGDGTFTPSSQNPAVEAPQSFVTVGDINGDGIPDLIGLSTSNPCKCISVFLGNGDGTFQDAVVTEPPFDVESIGIGDFNHDGKLDVVTAGNFTVNVLLGNGDGTFTYGASYPSGESPSSIAVADFNGDHNLDLAIANSEGGSVSVLLGKGDGIFQQPVNYPIAFAPSVAVADVNGDHKLDLVLASNVIRQRNGYSGATVFLGNGDGTFQQPGSFYESVPDSSANFVTLGDFNNDGKPDIAITDGYPDVVVMLNTGVVSFSPSTMLLFNQQAVGTTGAAQKVTLTNTGSVALKIASIKAAGQFGMTTTCSKAVAAGAHCTISVAFSPKTKGKQNGTVTIVDSASSKPQVIAMQGTGTN